MVSGYVRFCVNCPECLFQNERTRWSTSSKHSVKCELCKMHGRAHGSIKTYSDVNRCVVCKKPWGIIDGDDLGMVQCDICENWVHNECDPLTPTNASSGNNQTSKENHCQKVNNVSGLYACPPCSKKSNLKSAVSVSNSWICACNSAIPASTYEQIIQESVSELQKIQSGDNALQGNSLIHGNAAMFRYVSTSRRIAAGDIVLLRPNDDDLCFSEATWFFPFVALYVMIGARA